MPRILLELSERHSGDSPAQQSLTKEAMQLLPSLEPGVTLMLAKQLAADGRVVEAAKAAVVSIWDCVVRFHFGCYH